MNVQKLIYLSLLALLIFACKKDKKDEENPFDDPAYQEPAQNPDTFQLEPGSFAYLHYNIFRRTCANSGCHDGNFEPDFRTISSAYNTLVMHEVIQNDDAGTYTYRVEPNNVSKSLLYVRLTSNIPVNASGMMPLTIDQNSDWLDKKDTYIQMIQEWIEAGAPDMFGNLPSNSSLQPQVNGLLVFEQGATSNHFSRAAGQGTTPISVPGNRPIDVWLSVSDDETPIASLTVNTLKLSRNLSDYSEAQDYTLSMAPTFTAEGFDGEMVEYTHKATIELSNDSLGSYIYMRSLFKDGDHDEATEIPNSGSNTLTKSRFSLKVDSL